LDEVPLIPIQPLHAQEVVAAVEEAFPVEEII